jgi:hypothetical protein
MDTAARTALFPLFLLTAALARPVPELPAARPSEDYVQITSSRNEYQREINDPFFERSFWRMRLRTSHWAGRHETIGADAASQPEGEGQNVQARA